ncbi:prepilin-type N-terminal cleavage/methylation domain-containing protein [Christensenellaceae bacterium OttesenSCG-928-L17]|nr:prepilin-type N-terminal cleavage/methylation domain-containing protein [Christensenellaceae bacterium OttesenSCG-928-L17]
MNKLRKNLKNKKGFTLVEVIVVIVIIAILAAVMLPSLTGYIDQANEQGALVEARNVYAALQTMKSLNYANVGEKYFGTGADDGKLTAAGADKLNALIGIDGAYTTNSVDDINTGNTVTDFTLITSDGKYTVKYVAGAYETPELN